MQILMLSFFLLAFSCQLVGQEITDEFIDSLYQRELHYEFVAVRRINYALKLIEELDTVAYSRVGDELVYTFNGKVVDNAFDRTEAEKPVSIFAYNRHGPYFRVSIHIVDVLEDNGIEETVVYTEHNSQYSKFVLKHYVNDIPDGLYIELTPSGETLVEGNYAQIDSVWQDTVELVNPETYEITIRLIVRDKFAVKVGRWLYRNQEEDTIRIEEYRSIK